MQEFEILPPPPRQEPLPWEVKRSGKYRIANNFEKNLKFWTDNTTLDRRGSAAAEHVVLPCGDAICKARMALCASSGGTGLPAQCVVCRCWMMFLLLHQFVDSSNGVVKSIHTLLWTQNLFFLVFISPCPTLSTVTVTARGAILSRNG